MLEILHENLFFHLLSFGPVAARKWLSQNK